MKHYPESYWTWRVVLGAYAFLVLVLVVRSALQLAPMIRADVVALMGK